VASPLPPYAPICLCASPLRFILKELDCPGGLRSSLHLAGYWGVPQTKVARFRTEEQFDG
jgi:hypothetical protein